MAMWLCVYVAMWLYGHVAMWLYGYVAMWLSVSLGEPPQGYGGTAGLGTPGRSLFLTVRTPRQAWLGKNDGSRGKNTVWIRTLSISASSKNPRNENMWVSRKVKLTIY